MSKFLTHRRKARVPQDGERCSREWFAIRLNQEKREADVFIYDEISFFGVTAEDIALEVNNLDVDAINLRINSPGGLVFDGVAIYNLFAQHKARVVVHIDGLAASIASVIAMAGDEVNMADNAMMMIHKPLVLMIGNADELRKEADLLDQIQGTLVRTYQKHTTLEGDELDALMEAETWMDAQAAVDMGFANNITGAREEAASGVRSFDFSPFANAPEKWDLRQPPKPEEQPNQPQVTPRSRLETELASYHRKYRHDTERDAREA